MCETIKHRKFLASFLAAVLAFQPVTAAADMTADQEEVIFDDSYHISGEDRAYDGEEQALTEGAFSDDPFTDTPSEEVAEEGGFGDAEALEEATGGEVSELPSDSYEEDCVEAPVSATPGSTAGISLFSLGYYEGRYGEQLDEESKNIYDSLIEKYVIHYAEGIAEEGYADLEVNLRDRIYFEGTLNEENKLVQDENFADAKKQLKFYVQGAVDAFSYDYPEVFWFCGCTYGYSYNYKKNTDGTVQGYINTKITMKMGNKEIETDAHKEMPEFMASVQETVSRLEAETEDATLYEKVKKIHDYVCGLATYKGAGDTSNLVVHTARNAFLGNDPGFVCEGYAKTIKILCDRLGISCACVSGLAKSTSSGTAGAHMWNYIRMDDGNWYLVDATWDDSKDPVVPYTNYFLAGWDSVGFSIKISEERTESTDLSGTGGMRFIFPVLSDAAYEVQQDNTGESEDTGDPGDTGESEDTGDSGDTGKPDDGDNGENTQEPAGPEPCQHEWIMAGTEKEPTCTEPGRSIWRCVRCGETKTEELSPSGHRMTKVEAVKAGCAWEGHREYWVCSNPCCSGKFYSNAEGTLETSLEALKIPAAGHDYGEYVTTKEATVLTAGIKTSFCSVCGNTISASINKLPRTLKLNVTSLRLRVGQSFTVKASGLGRGDAVKSWKSKNSKIATVSSKGKITGKKSGTTVITVTLKSGLTKKISVKVQTGVVKTTKLSLNSRKVTLAKKGRTFGLKVSVSPVTSGQKVTYASSNTKVATVSAKGKITAKRKGTAVITVRSGTKKVTCKVTVKK